MRQRILEQELRYHGVDHVAWPPLSWLSGFSSRDSLPDSEHRVHQRILEQELRYHDVLDLTMLDEERGERENGIINMFECGAAKRRSSTLSH
jgi:hypothetical protein